MQIKDIDTRLLTKMSRIKRKPNLGGDPEFFIGTKDGKILSADKFFPSKHDPILIGAKSAADGAKTSKLFFDGIQAEMAVCHNTCREYFADNIRTVLSSIVCKIGKDHDIVVKPSVKINKSVINNADPEARIFGCEPDFNAYTCTTNTEEMDASEHPFRYAGGHIHLGVSSPYLKQNDPEYKVAMVPEGHLRIIKFLDLIVGIPSVLLDNSTAAKRRRLKYGKAGCFRPTPYGVEYRTLSCWWLKSAMTMSFVYGLARLGWSILISEADEDFRKAIGADEEMVRDIIDTGDREAALKLWDKVRPYLAMMADYSSNPISVRAFKLDGRQVGCVSEYYNGSEPLKIVPQYGEKTLGKPVFALAAFEYMVKKGLKKIISNDIRKEWHLHSGNSFAYRNGFKNGSFYRLRHDADFKKFQASFLKAV